MNAQRQFSVVQLYEDHREKLKLTWVVAVGVDRQIALRDQGYFGAEVVGHLNLIHPERLQVIGRAENDWGTRVSAERLRNQVRELMAARPPALIVADDVEVLPAINEACVATSTPLFVSPKPCSAVIDLLRIYLSRRLAGSTSMHGVLMDVFGMGVLITGDSGVGKSELALELITRGHGLVADDVVELACIAPMTIEGRCPSMLRDYLEVRGLGLLNIRTIFGETASRRRMKLKLIVHLQRPISRSDGPRLPLDAQTQDILGVAIRKVVIPVAAGRNIAVLLEAAVRNSILQLRGIDSMSDFINRQQQALLDDEL
ncbi:MAG TPA: HPr(Ser) kinase/phosphatase [Candidatus Accumulibacter phosphatis]|nr:MAG: HPr kinase/phosphorylase [Candidatus Accumulibacter sp. SK-11]HAY26508.1 HPr kinase/phosphorylase [Accumulibacter sp.]HCN69720.1 HPr kinase/phosphorylase [Accumulibacter sp.]HRL76248.1 HPr(Ser) kinase/phosphatase [Candidatus Accumulibacter phosphatis]HRQ94542.1 HPr(Ser) kinase/phosphatase [Candidatus Accumulibacter phosphatis]